MHAGTPSAKRGANLGKISLQASQRPAGQKLYLRTKNSVLRRIGLIFLALVAFSCFNEGDCLITSSNLIKVSLKLFSDKKTEVKKTFTSIAIPGDTVLYTNKEFA